jgi:Fungal Zn(2)-Cys(6) binuclear cluster domain
MHSGGSTMFAPGTPIILAADMSSGPTRRQNRSCDQCRKGKRKCDAVIPKEWPLAEKEIQESEQEVLLV